MSDNHDEYRRFCEQAPDLPIFMLPWYLDAVCDGSENWSAALSRRQGEVAAAWPFFQKQKGPWRYVAMPPLAKMLGPYVLPEYRDLRREPRLVAEMLEQMPHLAAFEQDCNYHFINWLPLYHQGFRQTTRYSYILDINDLQRVWQGMVPDYRNQKIKKASTLVRVRTGGDLAEFYRVHNLSFERQRLPVPFTFSFLQKLDAALAAHGSREIFFAEDLKTGKIHSVAYLIWDKTSSYLLLAGEDPMLRNSGAGILLTWETIRYTAEKLHLQTYDFAGSMNPAVERVRRQFGAVQRPYFRVQKEWYWLFKIGKLLLR